MIVVRALSVAVLVLALAACKEKTPEDPGAAAVSEGAATDADIDRCINARLAAMGAPDPVEAAASVARTCAVIYRERACREAHEKYLVPDPESRAMALYDACKNAYCDKLPEPKPDACTAKDAPALENFLGRWGGLRQAIWKHELSPAAAERLTKGLTATTTAAAAAVAVPTTTKTAP